MRVCSSNIKKRDGSSKAFGCSFFCTRSSHFFFVCFFLFFNLCCSWWVHQSYCDCVSFQFSVRWCQMHVALLFWSLGFVVTWMCFSFVPFSHVWCASFTLWGFFIDFVCLSFVVWWHSVERPCRVVVRAAVSVWCVIPPMTVLPNIIPPDVFPWGWPVMKLCPSPFIGVSSVIFPGHHFDSLTDPFIRCSHHTSPSDCPFSLLVDTTTTAVSLHDVHVFSLNRFSRVWFFTENGFVQHTSLFKGFIAETGFPQASALFHEKLCVISRFSAVGSSFGNDRARTHWLWSWNSHVAPTKVRCCRRLRLIHHVGGPSNVVLRSVAASQGRRWCRDTGGKGEQMEAADFQHREWHNIELRVQTSGEDRRNELERHQWTTLTRELWLITILENVTSLLSCLGIQRKKQLDCQQALRASSFMRRGISTGASFGLGTTFVENEEVGRVAGLDSPTPKMTARISSRSGGAMQGRIALRRNFLRKKTRTVRREFDVTRQVLRETTLVCTDPRSWVTKLKGRWAERRQTPVGRTTMLRMSLEFTSQIQRTMSVKKSSIIRGANEKDVQEHFQSGWEVGHFTRKQCSVWWNSMNPQGNEWNVLSLKNPEDHSVGKGSTSDDPLKFGA